MQQSADRDEDRVAIHAKGALDDGFTSLKNALRRKRPRPVALTPLDSPQHTHRKEDDTMDSNEEAQPSPPRRTGSRARSISPLPPLVTNILERKRLFLNPRGEPVVGVEELLQLQEPPSPLRLRASPLQLIAVPRKVFDEDEVALMPCHSLHSRLVPSLAAEKWKEPIRDRDKHWRDEELAMILATCGSAGRDPLAGTKMTRGLGSTHKGTWRKLDAQRLQIKPATSTGVETLATSPHDCSQPKGDVLLRVQGAMISKTYCVITIYGVGIYGRLYSEGLVDRDGQSRFLRINAYDPRASTTSSLKVSLVDLAWLFEADPKLLAAGRKQTVLRRVVSLLYFQYPDEEALTEEETPTPRLAACESKHPPVLCISPREKLNEAARRRRERDERLRHEEEERLRLLALLHQLPRRARHRVVVQLQRVSGHEFLVSIYQFPSQVRNFLVVAYHPRTSRTLTLAVGVQEAAMLSHVFSQPHKWTSEQKVDIARALVPRLCLRACKTPVFAGSGSGDEELCRVALSVKEDRVGVPCEWLALPAPANGDARKREIVAKFQKDAQQELRLTLEQQLESVERETTTKVEQLRADIAHAETALATLQQRDAQLKESIEELNSGKGLVAHDETSKQQHHEQRRDFKAARKTISDESKALLVRVAAWKREMELTREHALLAKEKAQVKYAKAVDLLTQRAITVTLPLWFDPLTDRKPPLRLSQEGGNRQRTRLHRAEIRDDCLSLASGACVLSGRRYRFSVFAELPPPTEEDETGQPTLGIKWFQVSFYDGVTSRSLSLRLLRLEWLALTKSQHDVQLAVAALGVPTSPAVAQVAALDAQYKVSCRSLHQLKPLRKNEKKRKHLLGELRANCVERRRIWREQAPWDPVVRALCDRLQVTETNALVLDRCLYRATQGIVSLEGGEDGGEDGDSVVECEVWVTLSHDVVEFHVRDLTSAQEWVLEHPDSVELVKEFAVESLLELTLHLEAIAMTLLLYTEDELTPSGDVVKRRKMRFEE